ncbi:hypothetical protein [Rhodoferax sp. BLA1]|uniref:hypothetical protein n=1 Tax=Rhodoferax sp. BLA1 TaxID=2576062 RepID=UPI0015D310E9|nr:hypothetical protein [Rhodoferax sp. BLA1]
MIKAENCIRGATMFGAFVHELGGPKLVAKFLDVTERTVWRWLAEENAPRAAILALYWETQYGRSLIDTDQVNEIRLLYQRIHILTEQYQCAKDIVTALRKLQTGSANEAYFDQLPELKEWRLNTWGEPLDESNTVAHADRATLKRLASR